MTHKVKYWDEDKVLYEYEMDEWYFTVGLSMGRSGYEIIRTFHEQSLMEKDWESRHERHACGWVRERGQPCRNRDCQANEEELRELH